MCYVNVIKQRINGVKAFIFINLLYMGIVQINYLYFFFIMSNIAGTNYFITFLQTANVA